MYFTDLKITFLHNGKFVRLDSNLWVTWEENECVCVPKGFICDMASIPNWANWLIPKLGPWNIPAVVHDYLYSIHKTSRRRADEIFKLLLREEGVSWWRRNIMYLAVRFGGHYSF